MPLLRSEPAGGSREISREPIRHRLRSRRQGGTGPTPDEKSGRHMKEQHKTTGGAAAHPVAARDRNERREENHRV
jgi:hypothetical protein